MLHYCCHAYCSIHFYLPLLACVVICQHRSDRPHKSPYHQFGMNNVSTIAGSTNPQQLVDSGRTKIKGSLKEAPDMERIELSKPTILYYRQ